jgi:hypothetical protein
MSKAAAKERLQSDDFRSQSVPERKTGKALIPSLPTLSDNLLEDEDVEGEESSKLRPVNIDALKDFMIKKVNKLAQQQATSPPVGHHAQGWNGGGTGKPRQYQLASKHLQSSSASQPSSSPNRSPRASIVSVVSTTSSPSKTGGSNRKASGVIPKNQARV